MHRVPFVSQRTYAFPNVTCGVAAAMMLLKFHRRQGLIPSFRTLRTACGIRSCDSVGAAPDDITRYFRRARIPYWSSRGSKRHGWWTLQRRLRKAPAMVGMHSNERHWGKDGHWIVIIDVSDRWVVFLDPQFRSGRAQPLRMRVRRFRREWDGAAIQVKGHL